MVAINHDSSEYKNTDYSQYSIKSWEYWCKRNDVDFMLVTEHDDRLGKPIWNKELIYERADGYDKIGVVDSDTMIKWDAPNIFEMYDDEFCGVLDNVNLKWVHDSLQVYGKFFDGVNVDIDEYINAGVLFFTKKHLSLFKDILDFYLKNQEELDNWNKGGGKEQTILNYHLKKTDFKRKFLTPSWNLLGMHKKQMFTHNWQLNEDKTPFFVKYGFIWHFTGFGIPDRINLMKQTWELFEKHYDIDNIKYDKILDLTRHRDVEKSTTTRKFKKDILDTFLNDKFKDKVLVEIGCHKGNSTKYLSKIFKKVYAVDKWHLDKAKEHCKDCDNVEFVKANLYPYRKSDGSIQNAEDWGDFLPSNVDVVFIDAGHEYQQVKSDIENALKLWPNVSFIFDDYGLPPGEVKKAIDEHVEEGNLKISKFIGDSADDLISAANTKFIDMEGCICNLM